MTLNRFLCRNFAHHRLVEWFLTACPCRPIKSTLPTVHSSTHLCVTHPKPAQIGSVACRHRPERHSLRPTVQVSLICASVYVRVFPSQSFHSGVSELHGYTCNMMLDYLDVWAAPTSIDSFTLSSLKFPSYPLANLKNISFYTRPAAMPHITMNPFCTQCITFFVCACPAILSGLRSLQEKIRRLELEKGHADFSWHSLRRDTSHTHLQNENVTQRELGDSSSCNQGEHQILVTLLTKS